MRQGGVGGAENKEEKKKRGGRGKEQLSFLKIKTATLSALELCKDNNNAKESIVRMYLIP